MSKRTGSKHSAFWALVPLYLGLAAGFTVLVRRGSVQLLEPAGYIADIQSKILWGAIIFAAIVASIIIVTFLLVATRYREGQHARYEPNWTAGKFLQTLAWGIPAVVIAGISVMVWITAHQVDPFQSISSTTPPMTIQVVALRWKWLFLYPNDKIATVNMLEIPVNTPVKFELTADAPMNSFWIPRLSGQMYAMTGMVNQLHIMADKTGVYAGGPAEISGDDFAGMTFQAHVVSAKDFASWRATAKHSKTSLSYASYQTLAKPSSYVAPAEYALKDPNLFDVIVMQFMVPGTDKSTLTVRGNAL
jgi:cytochrome o ubiquinol oxidase subunit 2